MASPTVFRIWQASWIFDFFNDFFSKHSAWTSGSGNPIDFFHPLYVALKNRSKVKKKKNVRKHKIDTKAGKTRVWNELRPKLIHQHLGLFFEKVVLSSAVTSWSLIQGPFVPKNSPNRAKSYYSFHWKLKEDRALILIYLDNMVAIFDFGHLHGVNWCQSWTKNSKIKKIKNTI